MSGTGVWPPEVKGRGAERSASLKAMLRTLAESGERNDPLVFGGRARIIDKVMRIARHLPPRGPKGNTILIHGAPGAGKTALVCEIARRLEKEGAAAIVQPEIPAPGRIQAIYAALVTALADARPDLGRTTVRADTALSIRPGGVGGDLSTGKSVAPPTLEDPESIADLRAGRPWQPNERAVVFIDEIQNIAPDTQADECRLVRALHTQDRIPVLLVCSGLSNSEDALGRAGLSRLGTENCIPLGSLTQEETLDCARATLDFVRQRGLPGSDGAVQRWAGRIAASSDGWPRHLQNYFTATWETLAAHEAPALDAADLDATIRRGDARREDYYIKRISRSGLPISVVGALHEQLALGESLDEYQAMNVIDDAIAGLPAGMQRSIKGRFAASDDCLESLLRAGIVSLDRHKRCVSPIPALHQFVLAEYGKGTGSPAAKARLLASQKQPARTC